MKPKRLYLFYNASERLVWQIPWSEAEPPYIVEAREAGAPPTAEDARGPRDDETVH